MQSVEQKAGCGAWKNAYTGPFVLLVAFVYSTISALEHSSGCMLVCVKTCGAEWLLCDHWSLLWAGFGFLVPQPRCSPLLPYFLAASHSVNPNRVPLFVRVTGWNWGATSRLSSFCSCAGAGRKARALGDRIWFPVQTP